MTQQITELPALWQEAEQHIRAFEQLARRTVEEAWLAGDALLRIKEQLPHGAWTPALRERGIPLRTAQRLSACAKTIPKNDNLSHLPAFRPRLQRANQPRSRLRTGPYTLCPPTTCGTGS